MNELVKGFIKWLIVVLIGLNLVIWLTIAVHCQTKEPLHSTQHKDTIQQQDEIRFMFVTVTEKNGNLVYFYREGTKGVEVSYMFWDEQSIIKDSAKDQFKGCYGMLYCLQHKYIYWLQRMPCSESKGSFYFSDH